MAKAYETGDFGNNFLNKYTQLLTSFHHQQQLHQLQHQNAVDEDSPPGFSSLIPSTIPTDQPVSSKDVKVSIEISYYFIFRHLVILF